MKTHKEAGDMTQTKVQTESPETYANKMGSYNLPEERIKKKKDAPWASENDAYENVIKDTEHMKKN